MYEFSSFGRHMRQDLGTAIRGNETVPPKNTIVSSAVSKLIRTATYSENAFSAMLKNLGPKPLARSANSVDHVTFPIESRLSSLIPRASASLAFLFLISHSPVQASTSFVPEQGIVERRLPQGHVSTTGA